MRKLVDLASLHLRTVDEFKDGGLHPGLCVPALARLPRARRVVLRARSGPGRPPRAVAARAARVRRRVRGRRGASSARGGSGAAVLAAQLALVCFGPGHGGVIRRARAARDRVTPADGPRRDRALLRRAHLARLRGGRRDLRRVGPDPSDVRRLPARAAARRACSGTGAHGSSLPCPIGLVLLWLRPIVDETCRTIRARASRRAGIVPVRRRSSSSTSDHHFRLARRGVRAQRLGRGRDAVPAAGDRRSRSGGAGRRSRSAESLIVLVLTLVPWLFVHVSDAVSLSQSRRVGRVRRRFRSRSPGAPRWSRGRKLAVPVALVAGIVDAAALARRLRVRPAHGGPGARNVDRAGRRSARARRVPRAPPAAAARAPHARPRGRLRVRRCRSSCTASRTGARDPKTDPAPCRHGSSTTCARRCRRGPSCSRRSSMSYRVGGERAGLHRRRAGRRTWRTRRRTTHTAVRAQSTTGS